MQAFNTCTSTRNNHPGGYAQCMRACKYTVASRRREEPSTLGSFARWPLGDDRVQSQGQQQRVFRRKLKLSDRHSRAKHLACLKNFRMPTKRAPSFSTANLLSAFLICHKTLVAIATGAKIFFYFQGSSQQ